MEILIVNTTEAVNSSEKRVGNSDFRPQVPVTVALTGELGVGEYIKVQTKSGDGWIDAKVDENAVQLDVNNTTISITSPMIFRMVKGSTTTAAGAVLFT